MAERLRYAGFVEEAEYNPDVAPAAAFHIDIASATLDPPTDTSLVYGGGRGRAPRVTRPGFYSPSGNIVYGIDVNTVGWFLKWALGGYAFTAGVEPAHNTHEIWGNNDVLMPSFTTRLGKDLFEHVFKGSVVNSFQLAIEGEFAMATLDIVSAHDGRADLSAVGDLVLPVGFPLAFHDFNVSIAGSDQSARVKSMTLTVNNNMDAEAGRGFGSRYPYRVVAGAREIECQMSLYYEDIAELQRFWGGADGPDNISQTEFTLLLHGDAADDGSIDILLPRAVYSQVQQQPSGRDELVQSVTAIAYQGSATLEDTTEVETDLIVTLLNQEAEMVLA